MDWHAFLRDWSHASASRGFESKTFGEIGEYKRQYVGAKAWKLATAMNKKFAEDMGSRWLLCNFETEMRAILRGDM